MEAQDGSGKNLTSGSKTVTRKINLKTKIGNNG